MSKKPYTPPSPFGELDDLAFPDEWRNTDDAMKVFITTDPDWYWGSTEHNLFTDERIAPMFARVRKLYAKGRLAQWKIDILNSRPGWSWTPTEAELERMKFKGLLPTRPCGDRS